MAALFQKRKKEPAEKAPVGAAQALQETIVCPACGREINKKEAEKNLYVSSACWRASCVEYLQFSPTAAHTSTAMVPTTRFRFAFPLIALFLLQMITDTLPR